MILEIYSRNYIISFTYVPALLQSLRFAERFHRDVRFRRNKESKQREGEEKRLEGDLEEG